MLRRPAIPLLGALGCAAAAYVVWAVAFEVPGGVWWDWRGLQFARRIGETRVSEPATWIASLANPWPYLALALAIGALALATRGVRGALAVAFVLVGANATTQYLKPALAIDRPGTNVDAASWPSGHSTAAMALALCLAYAAPGLARIPAAVSGVLTALAIGGSVVILGWHFPSDAVGGYLVAGCFMCLALAGLALSRPAATTAPRRRWRPARG